MAAAAPDGRGGDEPRLSTPAAPLSHRLVKPLSPPPPRMLSGQGDLWMVANRHLPYEAELKKRFAQVAELGGDARFKLFHATRPLTRRR